ncbi:MAG: two pore domain potassium channel family protein, partial [Pontibacterium sp.]
DIEFVRVQSYNSEQEMKRSCVANASTIIIDGAQDDVTLTAALYAHSKNPTAHLVAYFKDASLARLLRSHCPTAEVTPSVSVEMMVKASMDPGSSVLHEELLSADEGMTQFSVVYPRDCEPTHVHRLFMPLREQYNATLLAVDIRDGKGLQINPALDSLVEPGAVLYYIAKKRIPNIDWIQLTQA